MILYSSKIYIAKMSIDKIVKSNLNKKELEEKKKRKEDSIRKYQRSEKYKEYRRLLNKKNAYNKMKNYIDEYTEDDIDDIIEFDRHTVTDMRTVFKNKYGNNIYLKYISKSKYY
jgi:geranylgeranyl pyrophosphate synthase